MARNVNVGALWVVIPMALSASCQPRDGDVSPSDSSVTDDRADSPSTATDASRPPLCSESWCGQIAGACRTLYGVCPVASTAPPLDERVQQCADIIGDHFRGDAAGQPPPGVIAEFEACAKAAKTCLEGTDCIKAVVGFSTQEGNEADASADAAHADSTYLPPGVNAPVPGDKMACVDCAYENCRPVMTHCFTSNSGDSACLIAGGKPYADCCREYRFCLHECATQFGVTPTKYELCATGCDGRFPNGRKEFEPYQACMLKSCGSCANTDAGSDSAPTGDAGAGG
jgi:hypothetical protein